MKSRIKAKLEAWYETAETDDFLSLCSFLDPRFKLFVSKLALEVRLETGRLLWVKFGLTGLLGRDQKDVVEVKERRLNKAAFKEC